jgi:hypothetical protein
MTSKLVTIIPGKIVNKDDAERARGLRAGAALLEMLASAKAQVGPVSYYSLGLQDAEAALEAWRSGHPHGFFQVWEERRAAGGGHPPPSASELEARRMVLLLCLGLERLGSKRRAARKLAAQELNHAGVFTGAISHRIIERWQSEQPLQPTPRDEQLLATGIATCGHQAPHRLVRYFIGLAHLIHTPAIRVEVEP